MNLVIDIGNTRHKIGLFKKGQLVDSRVVTDWTTADYLDFCNQAGVQRVILSSVATPDPSLAATLVQHVDFLELTHNTPLPFANLYTTPETLGKDRLAAVAGAQALLPQKNCLAIDCGTCLKYDLITAASEYLGGNIAPGVQMRAKAMHTFTARLPEVEMGIPQDFIGNSTQTALQNGAFIGTILEIEGFIRLFQKRFAHLNILLTGGDAAFVLPLLQVPDVTIEPDLTLYGLNHILAFNNQ